MSKRLTLNQHPMRPKIQEAIKTLDKMLSAERDGVPDHNVRLQAAHMVRRLYAYLR